MVPWQYHSVHSRGPPLQSRQGWELPPAGQRIHTGSVCPLCSVSIAAVPLRWKGTYVAPNIRWNMTVWVLWVGLWFKCDICSVLINKFAWGDIWVCHKIKTCSVFVAHHCNLIIYIYIHIHKGLWKCISFLESFYKTEAYLFANSQFPCFLANCSVCVVLLKCALWMQWNISPVWFLVSWIINKQCWLRLKEVGEGFPIITAFSKMTLFTVYVWIVTFDMKFVLICIMFLFFLIFTFAGTRTVCIPTEYYQMRTKNYQSR